MLAGSTFSGSSPDSPSSIARSVWWPCPVSASDPNSSTRTRGTLRRQVMPHPRSCRSSPNRRAARIGPTVCELDGPIPILKISKMLVFNFLPAR